MMAVAPSPARERILDVADRLFYERGIHAVGVDTVVAESAVAKTTLYSHFRSKDELVGAYLRGRSERWLDFVAAELADLGGTPRERMLHVFDLLGEWFADPAYRGCPFINACAEFAEADHPVSVVTREHRRRLTTVFVDLCAEAGADSPKSLAAQLMLLYDAAMVTAQVEASPRPARTARAAAEVLLDRATGEKMSGRTGGTTEAALDHVLGTPPSGAPAQPVRGRRTGRSPGRPR